MLGESHQDQRRSCPAWIRFQHRRNLVVASAAALADGSKVPVGVSSPMLIKIYDREVFEDAFVLGNQMLLGQTALESMIVLVDCANRKSFPIRLTRMGQPGG